MAFKNFTLVDLTHPLTAEIPTWNDSCGFSVEIKRDYDKVFRVQQLKMHAGIGTHLDAPSHRFQGAPSIAEIPLSQLIARACLIDVSQKADADYQISLQDLKDDESAHGMIPSESLVIAYTGWSRFWKDPAAYRNCDVNNQMHFPAISAEAAEFLLHRQVAGIAIDTLSPDCSDPSFPVHRLLLGAHKYIIENIANASQLPPRGAFVIALPLKAAGCTESPIRAVGLIPK
jgi:kynurenine formamidase